MNKKLITKFIPIFIVMLLCVSLTCILAGLSFIQIARVDVLVLIEFFCIVFYIRYRVAEIFNKLSTTISLCAGIVIMTILMMVQESVANAPLWIFGVLFIAKRVDVGLALLITYLNGLLQIMALGTDFITTFLPLLICTLMCVLSSYVHSFLTAFFVFIISVAMQITILLAWNNFEVSILTSKTTIIYILAVSALIFVDFFVENILSLLISSYRSVNQNYFEQEDNDSALAPGDILVSAAYEAKAEEKKILKKLNQIKSEYHTLESQTAELREKRISLQDDINKLEIEAASYKSEETLKNEQVAKVRTELDEVLDDVEKARNELLLLQTEKRKLETQNNAIRSEGEMLKEELNRLKDLRHTPTAAAGTAKPVARKTSAVPAVLTDNEILRNLRSMLPKVYKYNVKITQISVKAAKAMKADTSRCYAAALYHEACRLYGGAVEGDFTNDVLNIFPTDYANAIIQSNDNRRQPSIKETAIVAFTDDVLRMIRYLRSKEMEYSLEKVVENVIRVRRSRGMFDLCDFTDSEITALIDFFVSAEEELTA